LSNFWTSTSLNQTGWWVGQPGSSAGEWELESVTCAFEAGVLQALGGDAGNRLHDSCSSWTDRHQDMKYQSLVEVLFGREKPPLFWLG